MEFRKGRLTDVEEIHQMMLEGIAYLKAQGSPQWQDGNGPSEEKVRKDIEEQVCYVLVNDTGGLVGSIALIPGEDPTYTAIEDGEWVGDDPYLSLHRVVVGEKFRGQGIAYQLLDQGIKECQKQGIYDIRIDTHRLNKPMQKVIKKHGFTYRGVVYFPIVNGERLAYQKKMERNSF